jgi:hypothetical protein
VSSQQTGLNGPANSRRRTTYLGWQLHGRIVARFAMYWGIYHMLLWEALCAREYIHRQSALLSGQAPASPFFASFVRENGWMIIFALIATPILLWDVVRLTHRVVGPLKRLEGVFQRMAAGQVVREVKFRKGDFVEGVEKALNTYLASLPGSDAGSTVPRAPGNTGADRPAPATAAKEGAKPQNGLDDDALTSLLDDFRRHARPLLAAGKPASGNSTGQGEE